MAEPAEDDALFDLVRSASLRERDELTRVLLATYRVELTRALRSMANRKSITADLDRVFSLAAQIAAAAELAKLPSIGNDALALERTAAAAHLGGKRGESDLFAAGLKVIEQILASTGERTKARETAVN